MVQRPAVFFALLLAVIGCSSRDSSREASAPADTSMSSTDAPASFINRVWEVAESKQVAPGDRRVFMSDGTLVMSSPGGTPAFGKWRYDAGSVIITEEGLEYRWEIVEVSESVLWIRVQGRGEPMEIRFKPAEQPPVPSP